MKVAFCVALPQFVRYSFCMSNNNRKQVKAITIKGTVFRVRYTFQKDNGSLWHVLDIGNLDCGPGQGDYGDEIPA